MPVALGARTKRDDDRRRLRVLTDTSGVPAGTLEDRVSELEATVTQLQQNIAYITARNHKLESIVLACGALITSVADAEVMTEADEPAGSGQT